MARSASSWFIRLSVIAAVIVGVAWMVRPTPIRVDTTTVARGTLESTVTAEGKTRVRDLFVVTAPVDGELERITFKAGDSVAPTTAVAHLRPLPSRPLDPRSRAEAEAAVVAARAAVQRAESAHHEAVAALTHAESASETSARLAREGVTAPKDAEHAVHEVEIRRQAVKVTQSAIEQARGELARAEAGAAISTPNTKNAVEVYSPTAGRVLRVLRESRGTVVAGTPLLEIGNTNGLEVSADFLTTDAMAVRPGARAIIRDWGGERDLTARVRHVEPGAFTKVSALGLEEQRVPVVLDLLSGPPPGFGNDFHVRVSIVVWIGSDVLTVPSTALFRVGEGWGLFVIRNGRAHLAQVAAGRSDGERTVVEQGLAEGDEVVIQPSDTLVDGARVRAIPRAR
jgi:HlyD family secretion protein